MIQSGKLKNRFTDSGKYRIFVCAFLFFLFNGVIYSQSIQGLKINELRPVGTVGPVGLFMNPFVELYNVGPDSVSIDDWIFVNSVGDTIAQLPAWIIPPNNYFRYYWGLGTNDSSFTIDQIGFYYSQGDSAGIFLSDFDELGIYKGGRIDTNLVDFVSWAYSDNYQPGIPGDHASNNNIWIWGSFVDLSLSIPQSSFGLSPDGFDHNHVFDWQIFDWTDFSSFPIDIKENPVHLFPDDFETITDSLIQLEWIDVPFASNYHLEIDNDSTFSSPEIDIRLCQSNYSANLGDDTYFWRIEVTDSLGNRSRAKTKQFQRSRRGMYKKLEVKHLKRLVQHKDTKMLCITLDKDTSRIIRHGCKEKNSNPGPWDNNHKKNKKHLAGCLHCRMYCSPACISIINDLFGGSLSQDEVAFQNFKNYKTGPEQDLGHGSGFTLTENAHTLSWALNGATVEGFVGFPDFPTIKAEILANRPIIFGFSIPGDKSSHIKLITGYRPHSDLKKATIIETNTDASKSVKERPYIQWVNAVNGGLLTTYFYLFRPNGRAIGGKAGKNMKRDADRDKIIDFDEEHRFCSDPEDKDKDSDNDGIQDKKEIRSYTFHESDKTHKKHRNKIDPVDNPHVDDNLSFPRIDPEDNGPNEKMPECDCDSDGDGDPDGGEDIEPDGINPYKKKPKETCLYRSGPNHQLNKINAGDCYSPDDVVVFKGGTLRKKWKYGYQVKGGCNTPMNGGPLAWTGQAKTNKKGEILPKRLGKFEKGEYIVIVDVLNDKIYREPDCHDPWDCFEVKASDTLSICTEPGSEDTVLYVTAKGTTFQNWLLNPTSGDRGVSQYFDCPQDITISGFEFFAHTSTSGNQTLTAYLYNAGGDSLPFGPPIDSASVVIDTFSSPNRRIALFTQPQTINQPYLISLEWANNVPAIYIQSNNASAGNGDQEWLAGFNLNGVWERSHSSTSFGAFNADFILHPFVSYSIIASCSVNPNCLSGPSTNVVVTNNSSPILENRMYNQFEYFNFPNQNTYTLEIGDTVLHHFNNSVSLPDTSYHINLVDTIYTWTKGYCTANTFFSINHTPEALFDYSTTNRVAEFFDQSYDEINSWNWTFGDGNSDTIPNPVHSYALDDDYNVCLSVTNQCGTKTYCDSVEVCDSLEIDFSDSSIGLSTNFINLSSSNAISWEWIFDDGDSSFIESPSHTFPEQGEYYVTLIGSSHCETQYLSKYITVDCWPPSADFNSQANGHTVAFQDLSTSTGTNRYFWDFGDQHVDTLSNPNHIYQSPGNYVVCLTIEDDCGNSTICKSVNVCATSTLRSQIRILQGLCQGENTAIAAVLDSGGVPPIRYVWDESSNYQNTDTAIDLGSGAHFVIVTDSMNCRDTAHININNTFSEISIMGPSVICAGSNIQLDIQIPPNDSIITIYPVVGDTNAIPSCSSCTQPYVAPATTTSYRIETYSNTCNTILRTDFELQVWNTDTVPPTIDCPLDIVVDQEPNQCGATVWYSAPLAFDNCMLPHGIPPGYSFLGEKDGHIYAISDFLATGPQADSLAISIGGHLATPTTLSEYNWLLNLITRWTWIGYSDAVSEGNFQWVTGEMSCDSVPWCPGEPNDGSIQTVHEDHVAMGFCGSGGLNDLPGGDQFVIGPFIVEFDVIAVLDSGPACGTFLPIGSHPVHYSATDLNNNTSTCTFNIHVQDTTPPPLNCGPGQWLVNDSGSCGTVINDTLPYGIDQCSPDTVFLTSGNGPGSFFPVGITTEEVIAIDYYGNRSFCDYLIRVYDVEPPVINCPANIIAYTDSGGCSQVVNFGLPSATDNCGVISINQTQGAPSGSIFPIGTDIISFTASDSSGRTSSCSLSISVIDTVAPSITCHNATVFLNANGTAGINPNQLISNVTDNCSLQNVFLVDSILTCSDLPGKIVSVNAFDNYGNVGSCSSYITVLDSIGPTAKCNDLTVSLNSSGIVSITSLEVNDSSFDACGLLSMYLTNGNFDCSNVGSNTTLLNVRDLNGNLSTCSSLVTVEDTTPPFALCNDQTIYLDSLGIGTLSAQIVGGGSQDACGIVIWVLTDSIFTCLDMPSSLETLTIVDANGNSATCTSNIELRDTTPPIVVCQDITVSLSSNGDAVINSSQIMLSSNDNCGVQGVLISDTLLTCQDIPSKTITLSAVDVNGNTSMCTSTVTIRDTIPPLAICKDFTVYLNPTGNGAVSPQDLDGGSIDDCGIENLTTGQTAFGCNDTGLVGVTLTVIDIGQNSSPCISNVFVSDSLVNIPVDLGPDTTVCDGNPVSLSPSGSYQSYSWSNGSTSSSLSVVQPGEYWILSYDNDDCPGRDTISVDTLSSPSADFSYDPPIQNFVQFIDQSLRATGWDWDFGDNTSSTLQNPSHTYSFFGPYNVCLVAENKCGTSSQCDTIITVGLSEELLPGTIEVFPNPNDGVFTVKFDGINGSNVHLDIANDLGQLIYSTTIDYLAGTLEKEIKLSQVSNGTYYMLIIIDGKRSVFKVLKQ